MAKTIGKPITKETARGMQERGVMKRKENQENDRLFKALIEKAFEEEIELKDGQKITAKMNVVRGMIREASHGNVGATKWLADMLGETPDKHTTLDLTTGGNAIEPITGVIVMPSNQLPTETKKKPTAGKKAT